MDYSIHDAIEAGFNKVVFIIRKDIEGEFKKIIGDRIASICAEHSVSVSYAFQDIHNIPGDCSGRSYQALGNWTGGISCEGTFGYTICRH